MIWMVEQSAGAMDSAALGDKAMNKWEEGGHGGIGKIKGNERRQRCRSH